MNIIEAIQDPRLFGALPALKDLSSWRNWLVFLKALYGLPLDPGELVIFQRFTGRKLPRKDGYPEAAVITGRQSGKTFVARLVGVYEATRSNERGALALVLAQDLRGAIRALFGYCREVFDTAPAFAGEVVRDTADTLELKSGVLVAVYPCRPASVRGGRAVVSILDELAHYITSDGRPVDREMLRAVRPTLATTGGRLLILSSPYGQSGALWDLHRAHYGREDSSVLVWQASAPAMNPTLPADYLERMRQEDPEGAVSEIEGEFRAGLSSLFDPDALDEVVARGVREIPYTEGMHVKAHFDQTGGRGDPGALSIGFTDSAGIIHIALIRRWPAPCNPETVIGQAAESLKAYHGAEVQIDHYAGDFPVAAFARHGVRAIVSERTTSEHHLGLLPLVLSKRIILLDNPDLLRELRGLERRTGTGGRDRVDHRRGAHDDTAAAVSGVAALLAPRRRAEVSFCPPDSREAARAEATHRHPGGSLSMKPGRSREELEAEADDGSARVGWDLYPNGGPRGGSGWRY